MACHDVAVNWLASEMQHICAKVNHASSVLASLSQHGISVMLVLAMLLISQNSIKDK